LRDPVKRHSPNSQYFNTAAFAPFVCPNSGIACIGNAGPVVVRGPGISDWNMSLFKNIKSTERMNLQFRSEAYNLFNPTQASDLDTTPKMGLQDQPARERWLRESLCLAQPAQDAIRAAANVLRDTGTFGRIRVYPLLSERKT
jgi:hypothetical protein